jgi:hypothetical protein
MIDLLRSITDPEHPVSLEQLRVVTPEDIHVAGNRVLVYLTPTIPHCSMSTLIGMSYSSSSQYDPSSITPTDADIQAFPFECDSCDPFHPVTESTYESKLGLINLNMLSTNS